MKKLTLGARLGLSFGALILLIGLLGGLAAWRIKLAAASAAELSTKSVAKINAGHEVDQSVWATIYNLRGYGLSGDEDFLRKGRKALAEVKEHLKEADDLVKRFPELTDLARVAGEASTKTADYEALVEKTEVAHKGLHSQRATMDAAGSTYMQQCRDLLSSEHQQLSAEIASAADAAKLKERVVKLSLAEELIRLGMTIRVNNFKAQSDNDTDALSSALKEFASLEATIASLNQILTQERNLAELRKIREAAESYRSSMEKVLAEMVALEKLNKERNDTAVVVLGLAQNLIDAGLETIGKSSGAAAGDLSLTSLILLVGLLVALVVGVVVAWGSTRAITAPISEGVSALSTTASQISATIAQLASNASETAAAVSETTTTVDEVRQTAQVAADRAKAVADSAKGAALAAETGRKATEQTVEGLNLIRDQMGSIGESITRLNEQSQAVGDIVSTVADLAEQSNLLAVNASIEAAKAGEAGKGFAVVAQEIRNLAEQSKDSTKQVRAILTEVQKATGKAVVASEQGVKIVADGSQQADEAGQAIASLTSTVQDSTRAAVQIAASSQQQLVGMEQVGRAMENIKNATAQNAEGARQLGTAAQSLQEIGARLKALISSDNDGGMGPRRK